MALETSLTFCHFFRHYLNNGRVTHLYSSTIFTNSKTPTMARFWNNGICMELEDLILLKVTEDARIPSNNAFSRKAAMLYSVHGIWNIGESH